MFNCLISGPLQSTPAQINSLSIPRLDPIDSKSSLYFIIQLMVTGVLGVHGPPAPGHVDLVSKRGLEDVTNRLPRMGDENVQDQAAHLKLVSLNPVLVILYIGLVYL